MSSILDMTVNARECRVNLQIANERQVKRSSTQGNASLRMVEMSEVSHPC